MKTLIVAAILAIASSAAAQIYPVPSGSNDGNSYNGYLANESGLSYNKKYVLDISKYDGSKVSAQVIYGTTAFNTTTFSDGRQSTGNITVVSYAVLSSATATDYITVTSTSNLINSQLTVTDPNYQIYVLYNGFDWNTGATTALTAKSLASAISNISGLSASSAGNVVYATATYGAIGNLFKFVSNNSSVSVNAAYFTGGRDPAVLTIGGTAFPYGSWTGSSNGAVATSIASAINASTLKLAAIARGSVVYATSTLNGTAYNYNMLSSTPVALTVSASTMSGAVDPAFSLGGSSIYSLAHGLTTGLPVLYTANSASIGGLTDQTTYYAIPAGTNYVSLATSSVQAQFGLPIVFTSSTTQLSAHAPTLAPLANAGTSTFIWQVSNDGTNYITAPSTGTVIIGNSPTDLGIDFGYLNYRYLRLNVTAPTAGGVMVVAPINIKQDGIGRF